MHLHQVGELWFRYEDIRLGENRSSVYLECHAITRITDKCVFFNDPYKHEERRVLVNARKRWANPTIPEAKESFYRRKRMQQHILRTQLDHVTSILDYLDEMPEEGMHLVDGVIEKSHLLCNTTQRFL